MKQSAERIAHYTRWQLLARLRDLVTASAVVASFLIASPASAVTLSQILVFLEADTPEDAIINKVETDGSAFDLTEGQIVELRKKGASERLIRVLLATKARGNVSSRRFNKGEAFREGTDTASAATNSSGRSNVAQVVDASFYETREIATATCTLKTESGSCADDLKAKVIAQAKERLTAELQRMACSTAAAKEGWARGHVAAVRFRAVEVAPDVVEPNSVATVHLFGSQTCVLSGATSTNLDSLKGIEVCSEVSSPKPVERDPVRSRYSVPAGGSCSATAECARDHVCIEPGVCAAVCATDRPCAAGGRSARECRPLKIATPDDATVEGPAELEGVAMMAGIPVPVAGGDEGGIADWNGKGLHDGGGFHFGGAVGFGIDQMSTRPVTLPEPGNRLGVMLNGELQLGYSVLALHAGVDATVYGAKAGYEQGRLGAWLGPSVSYWYDNIMLQGGVGLGKWAHELSSDASGDDSSGGFSTQPVEEKWRASSHRVSWLRLGFWDKFAFRVAFVSGEVSSLTVSLEGYLRSR